MSRSRALRLAQGGRIDRQRSIEFTFNGRRLSGYQGDTLASALLANGIDVVARSFKFHRPRGVLSAGYEEPNALLSVTLRARAGESSAQTTMPLTRATLQPLVEGMSVASENCFPSVDFDLGRAADLLPALWVAGFYNKTFKWPRWESYEPFVRRAAGLGRLPTGSDPAAYFHHNLHCDVLVVGGGVVGLSAALAASRAGARVVLVEQDLEFGGRLLGEQAQIEGQPALQWIDAAVAQLQRTPGVRLMRGTLVAGYYDHNVLTAIDQSDVHHAGGRIERYWRIRAGEVVLATGAIEQPLVFAHNDRPRIMLAGAVRTYLHRYGVAVGRNVAVATNNDDAWRTAFDLHDAGVRVAALVDARPTAGKEMEEGAVSRGLPVYRSSMIVATRGAPAVRAIAVAALGEDGRSLRGARRWIACDALAMSSGWNPTVHLYSQAGGRVRYEPALACLVPEHCRQRVRIAGAANGEFSLVTAVASGTRAGEEAARDALQAASSHAATGASMRAVPQDLRTESFAISQMRRTPGGPSLRQWVDFQHDVTTADIELAVRENYVSVEHLKRYTTTGMAIDQGKTSNLNAMALLGQLTDRPIHEVGTTTFRPQFMPVTLGAIGGGARGGLYAPMRHMPAHDWHERHGASLEDYGGWKRAACYPRPGETREQAIYREVEVVRQRLGLFEGSPLGKIEVRGRDAAQFLHRIYMNNALSLQPGRVRYGLMLNESGIVIDDGVFACLAPEHFLVSTTGANSDRIAAWLDEWHQCEWPQLDVVIVPVTAQWAVLTLAGAAARRLLAALTSDIDFSPEAFPHMSLRTGHLAGIEARVQRVSFSGELSYEISVPANAAVEVWEQLMQRGAEYGIEPVGIEAWLILRLEKGFLHVGTDTDGTTNPLDLGFGPLIDKKSGDFIGRRSLMRAADRREDRRQFVGLEPLNAAEALVPGMHLIAVEGETRRSVGFVTSAAWSPTLGRSIGLGLLEGGRGRMGEVVTVFDAGRLLQARVVSTSFYDPRGERMNA